MPPTRARRTATRIKQAFHWLLGNVRTPAYTVIITKSDGTDLNVSTEIITGVNVIQQSILFGLESCVFSINNDKGKYNSTFSGGEIVKITADYGSSKRIFKGKLNHPIFIGGRTHIIRFVARKVPELKGRRVKGVYSGIAVTLVQNIISDKFSDVITLTEFNNNLESNVDEIDIEFNDWGINVLATIFKDMGWDGRLDNDDSDTGKFDLDGFKSGTKSNSDIALVFGQNLIRVNRFGIDTDKIFNKITEIGALLGGKSIIRTKKDSASIANLWEKNLEISDSRLGSMASVQNRVESELTNNVSETPRGQVSCIGSQLLKLGYKHKVSSQYDNIPPADYIIVRASLNLARNFTMNVDIQKPRRKESDLINDRINAEEALKTFDNANDMEQTINLSFDDDLFITLSDLIVENGILKVASGKSTGSFTSIAFPFDNNKTQFDFFLEGPLNFGTSKVEVSDDNGATFDTGSEDVINNFTAAGKVIVVKVTLDGTSAELAGIRIGVK